MSALSSIPLALSKERPMKKRNNGPTFTGERLTPRAAIRTHCRKCNGGNPRSCPIPSCPLYPFRLTEVSPEASTTPLRAIRACCLDCAGSTEAVHRCSAYKQFEDIPVCALWPHRDGKRKVTKAYREARRDQAKKQLREPGTRGAFVSQDKAKG